MKMPVDDTCVEACPPDTARVVDNMLKCEMVV